MWTNPTGYCGVLSKLYSFLSKLYFILSFLMCIVPLSILVSAGHGTSVVLLGFYPRQIGSSCWRWKPCAWRCLFPYLNKLPLFNHLYAPSLQLATTGENLRRNCDGHFIVLIVGALRRNLQVGTTWSGKRSPNVRPMWKVLEDLGLWRSAAQAPQAHCVGKLYR